MPRYARKINKSNSGDKAHDVADFTDVSEFDQALAAAAQPEKQEIKQRIGSNGDLVEVTKIGTKIALHVVQTGRRGAVGVVYAHEVPMLARKAKAFGEELKIIGFWNRGVPREVDFLREDVRSEYNRLLDAYVFAPLGAPDNTPPINLVNDWVGPFQGGRGLLNWIKNVHDAWENFISHKKKTVLTDEDMSEFFQALDSEIASDVPNLNEVTL